MAHIRSHYLPLPFGSIRPAGWIAEFCRRDAAGITGNLDRLCKECSSGIFFDNKVIDDQDEHGSSWWNGESEGNWAEAFIRLSYLLSDPQMTARAKDYLDRLVAFQEPDGYLGIYHQEYRFRFDRGRSGELWTQSRVMLTLLAGFEATSDQKYLEAADRLATKILGAVHPGGRSSSIYEVPDEDGSKSHGLMIIEPLLALHRINGRKDVLDFCESLYKDFSRHEAHFPGDDCRLPNLLDPETPFTGHGLHTCEHLRIPLLLYYYTGKRICLNGFHGGFRKLRKAQTLSGSCKSDEMIGVYPPAIPVDQRSYDQLIDSLPVPTAGYELCSTVELSNTLLAALVLTGELQFADMQEWLVFNAAMAARQPDGKAVQYLSADNLYAATRQMGERWDYSPTHRDAAVCCAPNSGKVIPNHLLHAWMRDTKDQALAALLYGPCEVILEDENGHVAISEETRYPFENNVRFRFKVEKPTTLTIKLRIPLWSSRFEVTINGKKPKTRLEGTEQFRLLVVENTWQDGDELILTMDWQLIANRAVDGSAAISYGPLLYSLRIPEQAEHTYDYPLDGFHDTSYTPVPGSRWDYTFQFTEDGKPGKFITLVEQPTPDKAYEWETPPLLLQALMLDASAQPEFIRLAPIGTTRLRRTTFPWVERRQYKKTG
jgi:DUF1680 family protein